jgi:hypothetical protein
MSKTHLLLSVRDMYAGSTFHLHHFIINEASEDEIKEIMRAAGHDFAMNLHPVDEVSLLELQRRFPPRPSQEAANGKRGRVVMRR